MPEILSHRLSLRLLLYDYSKMKRALFMVLVGLVALTLAACSQDPASDGPATPAESPVVQQPQSPPATATQSKAPATIPLQSTRVRGYRGPLPPVPSSPYASAPPDVVRAVYEFAARRPEVLRYVPCFCGCERNGHQGNEDCFVASRDANGRPEWSLHGLT